MQLQEDISRFIENRFDEDSDKARDEIQKHLAAHPSHEGRVVRCVLFLSNGSLKELPRLLDTARADPRDVMFWAEYENLESPNPKHVRDFNQPFTKEDIKGAGQPPLPGYDR